MVGERHDDRAAVPVWPEPQVDPVERPLLRRHGEVIRDAPRERLVELALRLSSVASHT